MAHEHLVEWHGNDVIIMVYFVKDKLVMTGIRTVSSLSRPIAGIQGVYMNILGIRILLCTYYNVNIHWL